MGKRILKRGAKRFKGSGESILQGLDFDKDNISQVAIALAVKTAFSMGKDVYLKPGVQANIHYLLQFSEEAVEETERLRDVVRQIGRHLETGNIRPERIGVDGLPGSGKSTLARALAAQLDMKWICLDRQMSDKPLDFSQAGAVYEHHRLFRTQDLDPFDALIYLDEPLEKVERQILKRGRGAALIDVFDFNKMQRIGKKAFQIADAGPWQVPGTNVFVKVRPPEGFRERQRLTEELKQLGFTPTEDFPKEALLFLSTYGKPRTGRSAYVRAGQLLRELIRTAGKTIADTLVRRHG